MLLACLYGLAAFAIAILAGVSAVYPAGRTLRQPVLLLAIALGTLLTWEVVQLNH